MPEQRIPGSEKLEQLLTSLHAQLYVLHSQMATWQSSSASYTDVQLLLGWEIGASAWQAVARWKFPPLFPHQKLSHVHAFLPAHVNETREQRIEAILKQLRPTIEQAVRQILERTVDVPKAQEFGAIDLEFRDAGQKLANQLRQASLASRKKTRTAKWTGR